MNIGAASTISKSFDTYKYKKDTSHKCYVKQSEYASIAKEFLEELAYELITTGQKICLPKGLGCFQVCKYKKKNKSIDYLNTRSKLTDYETLRRYQRDSEKKVYHTNMGTKGYWTAFFWFRGKHPRNETKTITNARTYMFKPSRPNLRPNSYNSRNPRVSLFSFFKDKGWMLYSEIKFMVP